MQAFLSKIHSDFSQNRKITIVDLRKYARQMGFDKDDKDLWELAELAWVIWYRKIDGDNDYETYQNVVSFYKNVQPTFASRDSIRKIFQQYSTSAPIAWLAGWFTDNGSVEQIFEPSAGNGLLTIYYPPEKVIVNEIDDTRLANLRFQNFKEVTNNDASIPFKYKNAFDAVLTNPPFGQLGEVNRDYGWGFRKLDHVMVAHALTTMKKEGRAAIIIGGHTEFDPKSGVVKSGRAFFDWLFRHYRISDMINIDSAKMYSKQGTSFPLRMILVAGRKEQPFGFAPTKSTQPLYEFIETDFEGLYNRVKNAKKNADLPEITLENIIKKQINKIKVELWPSTKK